MARLALFAALMVSCNFAIDGQDDVLVRSRRELQKGRAASTISLLEDYRRQHPKKGEVYRLLGRAYTEQGKTDEALSMFKEFARLAPGRPDAYLDLGATYMRQGDMALAEQSFRQALKLHPNDPNTLYEFGALLNAQHEYSSARRLLVLALRRERSPGIVFELAVSECGLGKREGALELLRSARPPIGIKGVLWLRLLGSLSIDEGDWAEASSAFKRLLALVPNDQISDYGLGLARLKLHRVSEAIPLLERSLASVSPAERHRQVGSLLAGNRADAAAQAEFERAIAIDPKSYEAYYDLAVVRFRQKELDAAAQAATKALELHPSAEVHSLLGDIREEQDYYGKALEHLQEAVRLEPKNEEYVLDLGLELVRHENHDAARELFLAAQNLFPQSARIALGLGTADYLGGKNADAVQAFLAATKLNADYEPTYTFLGEAYAFGGSQSADVLSRLGDLAQTHTKSFTAQYYYGAALVTDMEHSGELSNIRSALKTLRRAAALHPGDGRTYYYLGEIDRLQGDVRGASRLYERAVALDPTLTEALYRLGWTYVKMGRREEAQRIFARQRAITMGKSASLHKWMGQIQQFILESPNTH